MHLHNIRELVGTAGGGPVESEVRRKASSQRRAGLGVWATSRHSADRTRIVQWKKGPGYGGAEVFAAAIVALIREWGGEAHPPQAFVTSPPQGASCPRPYAAELVAREVAALLRLPYITSLCRTDAKRWHGPWHARGQSAYRALDLPSHLTLALVVDDLVTSGATMRLSLEALRSSGRLAFGFAFSGC